MTHGCRAPIFASGVVRARVCRGDVVPSTKLLRRRVPPTELKRLWSQARARARTWQVSGNRGNGAVARCCTFSVTLQPIPPLPHGCSRSAGFAVCVRSAIGLANIENPDYGTPVVVQVECGEGSEDLGKCLIGLSLDAAYLEARELSQSLGSPREVDHPRVRSPIEQEVAVCSLAGALPGVCADSLKVTWHWEGMGVHPAAVAVDKALI